jgi:hypothetical protein
MPCLCISRAKSLIHSNDNNGDRLRQTKLNNFHTTLKDNASNNLEYRVSTLEAETKILIEVEGHQNRMAIKSKVGQIEQGLQTHRKA